MKNRMVDRKIMGRRFATNLFLTLFIIAVNLRGGELISDEHTLLLLHFNDNFNDTSGVEPLTASGLTFTEGIFGKAINIDKDDTLWYPMPEQFNPAEGSVELWLSPLWTGEEPIMRVFHTHDWHPITLQIDPGMLMHPFMLVWDNEANYYDINAWSGQEWHHLAVTWKIPGEMRLYVDGVLRIHDQATELDLLGLVPPIFKVGGQAPSENVIGLIDELRLSNIARSEAEILESVLAADFTVSAMSIEPDTIRLMRNWRYRPVLAVDTDLGLSHLPLFTANVMTGNEQIIECDSLGFLNAVGSGSAQLTAEYESQQASATVNVDPVIFEPEHIPVDSFLATPATGALWEVPVVIVQYLPVLDSILFEWYVPSEQTTLAEIKTRLHYFNRRIKFAAEEGSRYHGYQDSSALPSLGYRVVDCINIYEHMPMSDTHCGWNMGNKYPDYHQVMERIGGADYVNNLGVKEFWIWYHGHELNGYGFELPESNLSSPVTGDISNSARLRNDLPVYDHTYTVYQFDLTSNHAFAIHNFVHQIENQLSYINRRQDGNEDLFFKSFCGMDESQSWITGRCGWTHMPPNTNEHYHYDDTIYVWSDCEDWNPQNDGIKKLVNVATWRDIPYDWPAEPGWTPDDSPYSVLQQRAETHFYIYWRQNIPGKNNGICYGANAELTDWWQFLGNWDEAVRSMQGLYVAVNKVSSNTNSLLSDFHLRPNYPNPFNNTTRIGYYLPADADIHLLIYNLYGQVIRSLENRRLPQGSYELLWDGRNNNGQTVGSGVYFVQLQVNAAGKLKSYQQKMVLLK